MIGISGSFSTGHVTPAHDFRTTESEKIPANVDRSRTKDNVVLVDELKGKTPEEYIDDFYRGEIDKYNLKQKREDRRIHLIDDWKSPLGPDGKTRYKEYKGYCAYHKDKLRGDIIYETVMAIGENETTGKKYYDAKDKEKDKQHQMYVDMYQDMLDQIREKYPHIKILWATIHFDEPNGSPHMHVGYFGQGSGFKQGLNARASLCNALEQDGISRIRKTNKEGFQKGRWYLQIHSDIIKPEIIKRKSEFERILGDEITIKEHKGGRHIDTRLVDPDWKQDAENKIKTEREEADKRIHEADSKEAALSEMAVQIHARFEAADEKESDLNDREIEIKRRETDVDKRDNILDIRDRQLSDNERDQVLDEMEIRRQFEAIEVQKKALEEKEKQVDEYLETEHDRMQNELTEAVNSVMPEFFESYLSSRKIWRQKRDATRKPIRNQEGKLVGIWVPAEEDFKQFVNYKLGIGKPKGRDLEIVNEQKTDSEIQFGG